MVNKIRSSGLIPPGNTLHPRAWIASFRKPLRQLWPLLLPFFFYLPWVGRFPFPSEQAQFSDLVITHLPYLLHLRDSLLSYQALPFWNNQIFSGAPFAANPLAGLWYPFGWPALLLPIPAGFNLLALIHLFGLGLGMYYLLRKTRVGYLGAIFGALTIQFLPKLVAHYGAGHLTLFYAFCWTPWLLLAESHRRGERISARAIWGPGLVLALIFLADVRWAVYAGILWVLWAIYLQGFGRLNGNTEAAPAGQLKAFLIGIGLQIGIFALLTAPLTLPMLEFVQASSRAGLSGLEATFLSLPVSRLLGLIFPDFGGNQEFILYAGGGVFLLGTLAILWSDTRQRFAFWIAILAASVLLSMGSNLLPAEFFSSLPVLALLRVPARALLLTGFSMLVLASAAVDALQRGLSDPEVRRASLLTAGLSGFVILFSLGIGLVGGAWPLNFVWGGLAILFFGIWILFGIHRKVPFRLWFLVLVVLCLLDLGFTNQSLVYGRDPRQVWGQGEEIGTGLEDEGGIFRVYSPSYSLPQHIAARSGLSQADGVDPLHLERYAAFMELASGVPRRGYSVTVPSFETGDPSQDNAAYIPDAERLGQLNVRYVLAEFPLEVPDLVLKEQIGTTWVYRNMKELPRARIVNPASGLVVAPGAEIVGYEPNRVAVQATGPGKLVLSEVNYPGWRVIIDGKPAEIEAYDGIFRAVELSAGVHQVEFAFVPWRVYLGIILAVGCCLLFLVLACVPRIRYIANPDRG